MDHVVAVVLLVLTVPVWVAVALAIRLTSPGPALYRQERVGAGGRRFTIYKFRTMVEGADRQLHLVADRNEADGVLFKVRRDPRVTRVGAFLRRSSLDELPQLLNVVRGDMSLVGPRPPIPSEVERYDPFAHNRLLVKPGLTGLGQVSGRSNLSWDDTVRLDVHYVENRSLLLDLSILARTVPAVFTGRGAY